MQRKKIGMTTLQCNGQLLDLSQPVIMGILNTTPDSFYDGGRYTDTETAFLRAEQMIREGATIIDVGGASSRPGSAIVEEEAEIERVVPVIEAIARAYPTQIISVDTWRAGVAKAAVRAGAAIVNDISAGSMDPHLFDTVAELGVPYVLMHIKGTPQTMQSAPEYNDITTEVLDFLIAKVHILRQKGVKDIIIDPGFGFGKTIAHNYTLLKTVDQLQQVLQLPLLVGVSRKSMIYKLLNCAPEDTLPATSALNLFALQKGAKILRVHDVAAARDVITLFGLVNSE
jgi:dihydropteroate synthase